MWDQVKNPENRFSQRGSFVLCFFTASIAIVKSRDMHWGLLAQKDHKDVNFTSLRLLLVADGANPCTLYHKIPKFSDFINSCCNYPYIQTKRSFLQEISSKGADGMANIVDPDQTAPLGAV